MWGDDMVKDLKTNTEKMTAEIDLMENATYIVKDGKLVKIPTPPKGYGNQIVSWKNGIPGLGKIEYTFDI